jgi:hypothetical protein
MSLRDLFDERNDSRPPRRLSSFRQAARSPVGDPDRYCDRVVLQERLEADPDWRARRVAELDAAKPRPGDYVGRGDSGNGRSQNLGHLGRAS